jgi:HAMP domain-containing protein
MKKLFRFQRFKDVSISKKLYFIVGTMAVLIVTELVVLWFSIHTLSSVRAFVGAEGLWSKAQKDAVYNLQKYSRTHKEEDFHAFEKFMKVPFGDHKTLVELLKKNPDVEIARQGFIEGHINTADIEEMISLVRTFHSIYYIHKAVDIWSQGDSVIATLVPISARIHDEVTGNSPSKNSIDQLMGEVDPVNDHLTVLEDDFSSTLGEGSRWLEGLILKLLFSVALTVELTGLILSIFVSRGIRLGLNEINKAAVKITNGDLSQRAKVLSKDEIGRLALSVNQMTEQMISSNKELEAFIYKASHDLKSPLASSRGLVNLALREEPTEETKQYL